MQSRARKRAVSMLSGAVLSLAMAGLSAAPGSAAVSAKATVTGGQTVGLLCTWVAFETENESFVIDFGQKSLYWVNQNQMMNVKQFNSGRVVAEGIRNRLKVNAREYKEKVPVRVVFNRVSGDFILFQEAYALQAPGSCQKRYTF